MKPAVWVIRRTSLLGLGGWLACMVAAHPTGATSAAPPEPAGYRDDAYQSVTPATVLGVPALSTEMAKEMWSDRRAVFIDVLPHAPKPVGLPEGTIWNEKPHRSIAGAVWLPEVGRGALSAATDDYFRRNLDRLSSGDHARAFVVFCKRDCWMSWNAVKRARSYGFAEVSWYADGVEGWTEAGLPLAVAEPSP